MNAAMSRLAGAVLPSAWALFIAFLGGAAAVPCTCHYAYVPCTAVIAPLARAQGDQSKPQGSLDDTWLDEENLLLVPVACISLTHKVLASIMRFCAFEAVS